MSWTAISPVLIDLIGKLGTNPARGNSPKFRAEWEEGKRTVMHTGQAQAVTLKVTSLRDVGIPRVTFTEDSSKPPGQNVQPSVLSDVVFTLNVRVEVPTRELDHWAFTTMQRIRNGFWMPSTQEAFLAANLGLVRVMPVTKVSARYDDRIHSIATMDVEFSTVMSDADPVYVGWIETIELTSHVRANEELDVPPNFVDVLIPPAPSAAEPSGYEPEQRAMWMSYQGISGSGISVPIKGFSAESRRSTGAPEPLVTIAPSRGSTPGIDPSPLGIAFAPDGALWFCTWQTGAEYLRRIPPENLFTTGAIDREILTTLGNNNSIEFDADGNLWFNDANGNIAKYTPGQLTTSSVSPLAPTTLVQFADAIGIAVGSFVPSVTLAPDGWAYGAKYDTPGAPGPGQFPAVFAVSPAQLASGGVVTPALCQGTNFAGNPDGVAIGPDGKVWVAFYENSTVGAFSAASLQAGGNPAPEVLLTSPDFAGPTGLVFDAYGTLWVANWDSTNMVGIQRSKLLKSGNVTVDLKVETGTPRPAWLVLH